MNFWRAIELFNRRKWLILLSVVMVAALAGGATRLIGARWVSEVQFLAPERIASSGGKDEGAEPEANNSTVVSARNDAVAYEGIVKSRDVVKPVVEKLGITQLPVDFYKNISFDAKGPRLYTLQVTDASRQRSEQLANGMAQRFIEVYREKRMEQVNKSVALLEDSLKDADAKLAHTRRQFDLYRSKHQIVGNLNTSIDLAMAHFKDARQKREDIAQKLADARAQLQKQEAGLALTPATVTAEKPVDSSPLARQLQDDLDKADLQLAQLRRRYTDDWPEVKRASANRDALVTRLKQEKARLATTTTIRNPALAVAEREVALSRQLVAGYEAQAQEMDAAVRSASAEIDKFRGVDSPMTTLLSEIGQLTDARNALVARLNNARMSKDAVERQNPIAISNKVDEYNPPQNATAGRTWRIVLIASLAALVCSCALIVAFDSVDRRLKTVKEAEIVLPTRILAAIPQPHGTVTYADMARITEMQPYSLQAESYRFLGMHLLNDCSPNMRSLMVISAKAEQGSTTALTNLGITLAQAGKRVVLVDANIRTAELDIVFDLPNNFGYTDLLQEPTDASMAKALHPTSVENLSVITCGSRPNNPWQLFRSDNLQEVAQRLKNVADYILYDTPSSLMFTDALNLSPVVDGAFFSVRALEPLTGAEERIIHQFEQANVEILGGVLNDVPTAVLEGYHNYQHYYGPGSRNATLTAQDSPLALKGALVEERPLVAVAEPDHDAATRS